MITSCSCGRTYGYSNIFRLLALLGVHRTHPLIMFETVNSAVSI